MIKSYFFLIDLEELCEKPQTNSPKPENLKLRHEDNLPPWFEMSVKVKEMFAFRQTLGTAIFLKQLFKAMDRFQFYRASIF